MKKLKIVLPYVVVVVLVFALYNLQYDQTLTGDEAEAIAEFSEQQEDNEQEQREQMADLESLFGGQEGEEILRKYQDGETIHVSVLASDEESEAWATHFVEGLQGDDGADRFQIDTIAMSTFQSNNSWEFVENQEWTSINNQEADVVIYEPFANDPSLDQSMQMTSQIINNFEGYPILKIPSYENAEQPEQYVQAWEEFAAGEDIEYVEPEHAADEPALSDSVVTQR